MVLKRNGTLKVVFVMQLWVQGCCLRVVGYHKNICGLCSTAAVSEEQS